jgi:excisionase family DNA binding protein
MTAPYPADCPPDRLVLTVAEVATLLGVSRWLVQQAAHTGELPCIRLGRRILFPRARIEAIIVGEPPAVPPQSADHMSVRAPTGQGAPRSYPQAANRGARAQVFGRR